MSMQSYYELNKSLFQERNTHFWDFFSGDDLHSKWTLSLTGSSTGAMNDAADGGYRLTAQASSTTRAVLSFNDIRHYSETGSVIIWRGKANETSSVRHSVGLKNDGPNFGGSSIQGGFDTNSGSNYYLLTNDGTSASDTQSSLAADTSFHTHKLEQQSAAALMWIDGVLQASKTNNLPTSVLQPALMSQTRNTTAKNGDFTFVEAYNT